MTTGASLSPEDAELAERIEIAASRIGSRTDAALAAELSTAQLGRLISGFSQPSLRAIIGLASAARVSLDWLAKGEGPMAGEIAPKKGLSDAVQADSLARNDQDFVLIPRYDVTASAGAGAIIESDKLLDFLAFRTDWIRRTLALDPKRLAVISAEGDSMRPTIAEGDVLLVDTDIHHVRDSAIYVLQLSGVLLVKRVRIRLDGGVDVISDNAAYPPETVPARDLDRLVIAGRVVWHGGLV